MKRLAIFLLSAIISSILAVAGFNYYRYTRTLDKISKDEVTQCALLSKSSVGRHRISSYLIVKILPSGPTFDTDSNILLGLKTDMEKLRQGVECLVARDPKGLFLKIKTIDGQEVSHKWQALD